MSVPSWARLWAAGPSSSAFEKKPGRRLGSLGRCWALRELPLFWTASSAPPPLAAVRGMEEVLATLSRAPATSQARAGEEAYTDARPDAQAAAGPPPPPLRSAAFYSSVFAQVRQPLGEMPAPTEPTRKSFFRVSRSPMCGVGDIAFVFALVVRACRSKRSGGSGW